MSETTMSEPTISGESLTTMIAARRAKTLADKAEHDRLWTEKHTVLFDWLTNAMRQHGFTLARIDLWSHPPYAVYMHGELGSVYICIHKYSTPDRPEPEAIGYIQSSAARLCAFRQDAKSLTDALVESLA